MLATASQENSRVGIWYRQFDWLPLSIQRLGPIGKDLSDSRIRVRRFLDPPIDDQLKILVLAIRPERFIAGRFAFGVIIENLFNYLPMTIITFRYFPILQIDTGEQRHKTFAFASGLLRRCTRRWQFLNPKIAKMAFGAF